MRKIVFLGNCQGRRLQVLFDDEFRAITGDTTDFVVSYEPFTDRVREILLAADIIVAQAIDSEHSVNIDTLDLRAEIILYPNITGAFLWPFSGDAHILNEKLPHFHDGPYGREYGDRWLNRKIKQGAQPADIIREYLELDVPKVTRLDRMYELLIERGYQRDVRTGFAATEIIEREFRDNRLFLTPANLELPLFVHVARIVYDRLGVPASEVERVLAGLWRTPFPLIDLPIHPAVARHFGLKYIDETTRYRTAAGELLSFVEWVERYVRYEWNDPLLRGTVRAGQIRVNGSEVDDTIALLRQGLAQSPSPTQGSAGGYAGLGHLLLLKGDTDAAFQAMQQAEACDPTNPQLAVNVAHQLAERGDLDAAERRLRDLADVWPHYSVGWARLAHIFARRGNGPNALSAIQRAVALSPRDVSILTLRAHLLHRFGNAEDAAKACDMALAAAPRDAALPASLARICAGAGRLSEALTLIDRAIALARDNMEFVAQKIEIANRQGDLTLVEATLRAAIAEQPGHQRFLLELAELLEKTGRSDEAADMSRRLLELDPDNKSLRARLAAHFAAAGDLAQAEELYRGLISRDWNDAAAIAGLAKVLQKRNDLVGAMLAMHRVVQLCPNDPRMGWQLAQMMMDHSDWMGAEAVLRRVTEHAPSHPNAWFMLTHPLLHLRRFVAAIEAIDVAIRLEPSNQHLKARRAYIQFEMGDQRAAEATLLEAISQDDRISGLFVLMGDVMIRQGRKQEALGAFRRALELNPSDPSAGHHVQALSAALEPLAAD